MEFVDIRFFKFIVSSNIRTSILFSLMEGSKKSSELKNEVDANSRNLLKVLKELIFHDLVCKNGKEYSLTNSGRLVALNLMDFMDKHS